MKQKVICIFAFFCATSAYFLSEEECLNYTIYPVQYELTLYPNILGGDRTYYDCDMIITIIANAPNVDIIEIDAKDLDINRDSVQVLTNKNENLINSVRPYEFDRRLGKLYLFLNKPLEVFNVRKSQYYVRISFRKIVKPEDRGVFLVKYIEEGHEKYMVSTRLSHNKAKYFFPCFENNQFEAVFKFKVYLQSRVEGQYRTCLVIAEEMKTNRFKETSLTEYMPSPQVAVDQVGFHISDFTSKTTSSRYTNDTLKVWAPRSTLSYYNYILQFGRSVIEFIHKYSTVNGRLVTGPINLIAVPTNLKNYEVGSWNLLTIGDHYLAYSPRHTSIVQKQHMSFLLSQQLSRVWLGSAGEPQRTRWAQEWFKEGVATYLGHYFITQSQNSHLDMGTYAIQMRHKAMTFDCYPETPTLESFNRTLATDMTTQHHDLAMLKTASLLWMIENWIGSEKFHLALVKYVNSRRGKFISVEDFTKFLEVETKECEVFTGHTAAAVLNSWFRQPGYPLVKVTVYRRGGKEDAVYLEQRQFTFKNTSSPLRYLIPMSYIQQYPEDCYSCRSAITVDAAEYSFMENLRGGWIVLNRNASGYYRVNYDAETWKAIINTLNGPDRTKIDALNRAQIINDAFALYVSGNINLELARAIAGSLEFEEDFVVWDAAISGFHLLQTDGAVYMTKQLYDEWKALMRDQVSIIYRKLFNDMRRDDSTRLFRSSITSFACSIGLLPCLSDLQLTKNLILQRASYDPDFREIAYYTLLNESGAYDIIKETSRFEKEDLVAAENKAKEEMRFVFRLPSHPRPMHLVESTTRHVLKVEPSPPVIREYKRSKGSRIEVSLVTSLTFLAVFSFR